MDLLPPEIIRIIMSNLLFDTGTLDECVIKTRAKAIVQLNKTCREIVCSLMRENGVSFHFLSSFMHIRILTRLPPKLPLLSLLPVNYYLDQVHVPLDSIKQFLLHHSHNINSFTYSSNEPGLNEVDLLGRCNFSNLQSLRLFLMNSEISDRKNRNVRGDLFVIIENSVQLKKLHLIDDCDRPICCPTATKKKITLAPKISKLKVTTRRMCLLQLLNFPAGLNFLRKLSICCMQHLGLCLHSVNLSENVLNCMLQASKSSVQNLQLSFVGFQDTFKLKLPILSVVTVLELTNVHLIGWSVENDSCKVLPFLRKIYLKLCTIATLNCIFQAGLPSATELELVNIDEGITNSSDRIFELDQGTLNSVVRGVPQCTKLTISWNTVNGMKRGMCLVFQRMSKLRELHLVVGGRFWQGETPERIYEALLGVDRFMLEIYMSNRSSWGHQDEESRGILNLHDLTTISIENCSTERKDVFTEFLFEYVFQRMIALNSITARGFAVVNPNAAHRWRNQGKHLLER